MDAKREKHKHSHERVHRHEKRSKKNWSMSPQVSHFEESDIDAKSKRPTKIKQEHKPEKVIWGKDKGKDTTTDKSEEKLKEGPNFGLSGRLAEDTNKFKGVVIKYNEPPEARVPKIKWRLYPFKSGEALTPILHLHRQSAYMIGRDRRISEIPVDHPSCSKQHAVLQFRAIYPKVEEMNNIDPLQLFEDDDNTDETTKSNAKKRKRILIKPYIIDLGSANGTFLNNKPIESNRYYELLESDVLKFGFSTREYVLLHENSSNQEELENDQHEIDDNDQKDDTNDLNSNLIAPEIKIEKD